jgi:hypothetical protein
MYIITSILFEVFYPEDLNISVYYKLTIIKINHNKNITFNDGERHYKLTSILDQPI